MREYGRLTRPLRLGREHGRLRRLGAYRGTPCAWRQTSIRSRLQRRESRRVACESTLLHALVRVRGELRRVVYVRAGCSALALDGPREEEMIAHKTYCSRTDNARIWLHSDKRYSWLLTRLSDSSYVCAPAKCSGPYRVLWVGETRLHGPEVVPRTWLPFPPRSFSARQN
jgi:hypothetical protein